MRKPALAITVTVLAGCLDGGLVQDGSEGLPGPAEAGIDGLRDILLGVTAAAAEPIAGGRHKVFGRSELAVVPMTSTIASHLPRAVGTALSIDRAARLGLRQFRA